MDNNNVRLQTVVRVGRKLRVFETHMLGLLKIKIVCTTAGAFESATVFVASAMLATLRGIRLASAHGRLTGASVLVSQVLSTVLLISEANAIFAR